MNSTEPDILISELANDPDLLDLVTLFVNDLPVRVASLRAALDAQDYQTMARLTHQLKGSAGGYGFPRITEVAKMLEGLVKSHSNPSDIRKSLDQLAQLCAKARAVPA